VIPSGSARGSTPPRTRQLHIANHKEYAAEYGLGYDVKTLGRVTLPGHTGNLTMTYAAVPSGADDHS
jgi:hypothetical protein